jgi:hypothetical protein
VPVEEVRAELHRLVQASTLWDGREWVLQVVDSTPTTMVLRALMSSPDAPSSWDLRCEVREKLLAYLRDRYPASLPRLRAEVAEPGPPPGAPGGPAGPAGQDCAASAG